MDQPDTMTLTLRKPIVFGPNTYDKIELREPTAGEMQKATGDGVESNIRLIALITGIDRPAIERMGARDFHEAVKFLAGFTNPGPETGES
jgi:hypothetical protein